MNRIKILAVLIFVALLGASCENNDYEVVEVQLEVNANNISGKWELAEERDYELIGGTYVFIEIFRNGKEYTLYQNVDTFKPRIITGKYNLEPEDGLGIVIRGSYDHDSGDWAHRYVITSLTKDEMVWVAKDDPSLIQNFVRVDEIHVAE